MVQPGSVLHTSSAAWSRPGRKELWAQTPGPPKLLISCPYTLALSPAAKEVYVAVSQGSPGWKAELEFSLTWKMRHSQWQTGKQGQMKPCPVCPWSVCDSCHPGHLSSCGAESQSLDPDT